MSLTSNEIQLLSFPNVSLVQGSSLNPVVLLTLLDGLKENKHDCNKITDRLLSPWRDLLETPIENVELVLFTDSILFTR